MRVVKMNSCNMMFSRKRSSGVVAPPSQTAAGMLSHRAEPSNLFGENGGPRNFQTGSEAYGREYSMHWLLAVCLLWLALGVAQGAPERRFQGIELSTLREVKN